MNLYLCNKKYLDKPLSPYSFCGIVGVSKKMKEIFSLIKKVAPLDVPVIIFGETGTGKELVAKALHFLSKRANGPFIPINCSAIPKEIFESELFGHIKGAFTNAYSNKTGVFEMASGGTLFLDELGEMEIELQSKILRAIEMKEIKKVGGNSYQRVDIRIISATNRNLQEEVFRKNFREDLFYRLYVIPISLPPLRERIEDIPYLVDFFMKEFTKLYTPDKNINISEEALQFLMEQPWYGNIRELRNVIERAIIICSHKDIIEKNDLKNSFFTYSIFQENGDKTYFSPLKEMEKEMIYTALNKNHWNKKATAYELGIAKSTLFEKIKKYGIERRD